MTDKIEILDAIETMVKPLNPPVQAFENSIRTSPYRILISVLLSSRTKDAVTMKASKQFFSVVDSPADAVGLEENKIEELIYPVGFFKQKAKHIKKLSQMLVDSGKDTIPDTYEGLIALPGVGRKTANLVLALAFNIPSIAVDIHVFRISQRLGWAKHDKPEEIEKQLMKEFPAKQWNRINQVLVGFGQTICAPRAPLCKQCNITADCLCFKEQTKTE
ncbi:MAG: endonuclease III [bacterium]|nr:endonuclease III [bacterium]